MRAPSTVQTAARIFKGEIFMKENLKIGLIIADTEEFAPVKKELIKIIKFLYI